jgi:DRG Family Regulatory Proteins, Tma46
MPPKKQDSSKKTVEDKTFGLKNKHKSKKVQEQIKSIEKNVMNSGDPKQRKLEEQRKQARVEAKARKKAMEDEQNALFSEALLAVQKKTTIDTKSGKQEAQGRDGNDDGDKKSTSRAMKMMFQMDAQEMSERLREDPNYVPTLEDEIEEARQAKVAEMKKAGKGTPVTPESFAAWQERKRARRQAENKKLVEAEFRKKKGGKGLAILTGRDLFEYKRDLFLDREDDAEDGASEDEDLPTTSRQTSTLSESDDAVQETTKQIDSQLFLQEADDDLDDLDDD